MMFGYARVSTEEQNLNRQLDQLKEAGAEKIYKEKITGTKKDRPELTKLLEYAREGDTIVITDLTRISRSTKDLISLVEDLGTKGINLKSLKENWLDTTTSQGKLMFTIIAGLSQFERDLISERTKEGLKSARARGKVGGRPTTDKKNIDNALMLYDDGKASITDICTMCKISKNTLYNYIRARKKEQEDTK
ncbi:recombinase family protein [Clostridium sp.]|uniref:recombinase family protein n=1 Tax=Clostridium sp. TaxID=1506 RepID=UPI002840AC96|nr:recombinase family protein [Clostridium sp.]MDR3598506.1 recombinase family protein [Clostridium sp.]